MFKLSFGRRESWLGVVILILALAVMLPLGLYRAMFPGLHGDESYYLGAAVRMLGGDIFLTSYGFDKLPLAAYLLALGIEVGGQTPLGFHLAGLVASILGLLGMFKVIDVILGPGWLAAFAKLLYLLLFATPFMIFHDASSFTDPFLLAFLSYFLLNAWRAVAAPGAAGDRFEQRAYVFYALAVATKFSALMWAPVLLGLWVLRRGANLQSLRAGAGRLWQTGRWFCLWALFVMLTLPAKLAPILWFSQLLSPPGAHGAPLGAFGRVAGWIRVALTLEGPPFVFWLLLAAVLAVTVDQVHGLARRDRPARERAFLCLVVVPFWLHVFGLWLSGAAIFPRYLYIVVPQVALVAGVGLALQWARYRRPAKLLCAAGGLTVAVGVVLAGGTFERYWRFFEERAFPAETGRLFLRLRDELPANAVIHHDAQLWALFPMVVAGGLEPHCHEDRCLREAQIGRFPYARQFRLAESIDQRYFDLRQAGLSECPETPGRIAAASATKSTIDVSDILQEANVRSLFRIAWWGERLAWIPGRCQNCGPGGPVVATSDLCWLNWAKIPELPLELRIDVKPLPLLPRTLHIQGNLIVNEGTRAVAEHGTGRWILSFQIRHIYADGVAGDFVDIAPVLYGSYDIPLAPLDLRRDRSATYQVVTGLAWSDAPGPLAIAAEVQRLTGGEE